MTDELDKLKSALQRATPDADPDARARAIAAARENFKKIQGTTSDVRPTSDRLQKAGGFWTGARQMINSIGLRPVLYATSCIVVAGFVVVSIKPVELFGPTTRLTESRLIAEPSADRKTVQTEAEMQVPASPLAELRERDATEDFAKSQPAPEPMPQVATGATALMDQDEAVRPQARDGAAPLARLENAAPIDVPASGIMRSAPAADPAPIQVLEPQPGDRFAGFVENAVKSVAQEPVSTFSIDVDTASYAFVRRALLSGQTPPANAVRIEEMINYFPYDYAAPDLAEAPFSTAVSVLQTPWNPDTQLVHIGIQGAMPAIEERPSLNLVFLIDTSGSMQAPNKLPLLKQSFRLLLNSLRPSDQVAIVTYAGSAGTVLQPTPADQTNKILDSLNRLHAGGSTAGQAGLQQAYALAEDMRSGDDRIGRVILATDGDFNVGISDPERLKSFVEDRRESGVYLSVLGFGAGNYRDDMMQSLAQNGNGTAAYIDTLAEAQKVLVDQVSGALFPIANDVKIQVEFNPVQIAEYRLIGYETRALNREDFNNDKVDAGEIGAGHTVTALYEVTPVGSPALRNDPLRYATGTTVPVNDSPELGFLKLRYKDPGASRSKLIETPILNARDGAGTETSFAAAIAGFGQLLTGATYLADWGWDEAIALAQSSKGADPFGYRGEAIRLMQLAKSAN